MDIVRTPVSTAEIQARLAAAFARNPWCRSLSFDVVAVQRLGKGANWTISLPHPGADVLWEASEIVSDLQDAYALADSAALSRAA